jgi:hypothetical protein
MTRSAAPPPPLPDRDAHGPHDRSELHPAPPGRGGDLGKRRRAAREHRVSESAESRSGAVLAAAGNTNSVRWIMSNWRKASRIERWTWVRVARRARSMARRPFALPVRYPDSLPEGRTVTGAEGLSCWKQDTKPGWRNGRRGGLKSRCPQGRAGSTPAPGIRADREPPSVRPRCPPRHARRGASTPPEPWTLTS